MLLYDLPLLQRCQPISYEAVNCVTDVLDVVESVLQNIICQKCINLDLSVKLFVFTNELGSMFLNINNILSRWQELKNCGFKEFSY